MSAPGGAPTRPAARSHSKSATVLDPIITMNAAGVIHSASESVEHLFGWKPGELLGCNVKVLIPEPKRSALDQYLDRYRDVDRSKERSRTNRFAGRRKDGAFVTIELSVSRADLPAKSAPYFIGIIRDVSQEIDTGANGSEERTRLQKLVTEKTRALATASLRLHLADRLASIGTLAAGLGHDLNNVLLPIRAHLNALEHVGLPDAGLRYLAAVRRSITYLQHLSDGFHFLALDPDGTDESKADSESTDLRRWWSQVGDLLRRAVPKRVRLSSKIPNDVPPVRIAAHWLTQAMLNLVVNAGESIPAGRAGQISLWAKPGADERTVLLGLTDNGRGMGRGVQTRAFDLFFTTKSRSMGTGLGLPLARKLLHRAGGQLDLQSEPRSGTTALVTLLAAQRNGAVHATKRSARPVAAVAVHSHKTAALITQVLIAAGFDVESNGESVLERASLWLTEPTPSALRAAIRWRAGDGDRTIILCYPPSARARAEWTALGASIIEQPDSFESIVHTLESALGNRAPRTMTVTMSRSRLRPKPKAKSRSRSKSKLKVNATEASS